MFSLYTIVIIQARSQVRNALQAFFVPLHNNAPAVFFTNILLKYFSHKTKNSIHFQFLLISVSYPIHNSNLGCTMLGLPVLEQ